MNKNSVFKIFLLGSAIALFAFKMAEDKTTLYIIGDSTAANKSEKTFPETGWGMKLQDFFRDNVVVDNRALNGRSTKSFINEKRWQPIYEQLKAGDYVFIEFGHNDEKVDKPKVGTSITEFKANLVKYIIETREKKAFPILLTPIARRNFIDGKLVDTHGAYPDATRKVADSLKVPMIDMTVKTDNLLKKLGDLPSIKLFNHVDSGNVNYPKGVKDNTHLSPQGAAQIAGLVVKGIKQLNLPLAKKLK